MKKILFGITSLTLGGAERVLVDLVNDLANDYEVTIFTLYAEGELEKQLKKEIIRKSYKTTSYEKLTYFQKHILLPLKVLLFQKSIYHNKIQGDYDVEIAFLEGPITRLFSTKNKKAKKIAWIHNDISKVFGNRIKAKMKKRIDQKIYNQYEELVFVSKDNLTHFEKTYPEVESKKQVIYNYLNQEVILQKAEEEIPDKFKENIPSFVTVTRLVEQKGIDRLIKVHSKLIKNGYQHEFYVIGDGPEKEKLQKQIQEEKVEDTFKLLGKKENPYPYIKKADYFCLFSYFEGYGMVLEEAKILNQPIIITDTAAREAVEGYQLAKIVPNTEEGMIKGLKQIIEKEEPRIEKKEIKENNYDNANIMEQVKKLIGR